MMDKPRYSNLHRIGLIIPSLNVTIEPEFNAYAPEDVSVHVTRLLLSKGDPKHLAEMGRETEKACKLLGTANVSVIAYACTSGSLIGGSSWEKKLAARMRSRLRIPVVTTARSVVDAFRELGISKVAVATPYVREVNQLEKKFLEQNRIGVTKITGLGYVYGEELHREPPAAAIEMAEQVDSDEAEGIFLSCTDLKTFTVLDRIERLVGKPVVSSNSATLWSCLRAMKLDAKIPALGSLLR
jgi:maleate isomerase